MYTFLNKLIMTLNFCKWLLPSRIRNMYDVCIVGTHIIDNSCKLGNPNFQMIVLK